VSFRTFRCGGNQITRLENFPASLHTLHTLHCSMNRTVVRCKTILYTIHYTLHKKESLYCRFRTPFCPHDDNTSLQARIQKMRILLVSFHSDCIIGRHMGYFYFRYRRPLCRRMLRGFFSYRIIARRPCCLELVYGGYKSHRRLFFCFGDYQRIHTYMQFVDQFPIVYVMSTITFGCSGAFLFRAFMDKGHDIVRCVLHRDGKWWLFIGFIPSFFCLYFHWIWSLSPHVWLDRAVQKSYQETRHGSFERNKRTVMFLYRDCLRI
jgi:hypothetical protein